MKKDEIDNLLLSINKDLSHIEKIPARSVVYLFKFGWLVDNVTSLTLSCQSIKRLDRLEEAIAIQSSMHEIYDLVSNESLERKRPISVAYISKTLSLERKIVSKALDMLLSEEKVKKINTAGNNFGIRWAIANFNPLSQTSEVFDINSLFT